MITRRAERPILDAPFLASLMQEAGIEWPEEISRNHFYAIIVSRWTSKDELFSQPKIDSKGFRLFKEFRDVADCYRQSDYHDFMDPESGEIDLEVFQYNRGRGKVIFSKILFP